MRKSLFAAILVFSFSLFGQSWAANLYVSPAGGGDGTIGSPTDLQSALDVARTNGENDTIVIQQGTYSASSSTFTYGSTGNDNMALTLSGGWNIGYTSRSMDRTLTVLDGGNASRVLEIIADVSGLEFGVTIQNLTIQNGNVASEGGAGIRAYNADGGKVTLVLNNCLVRNNVATGLSGGGILTYGLVEIYDSQFTSNQARNGGAIFISYVAPWTQAMSPVIDHCLFNDNHNVGGWQGSTIFNNVSLTLRDSTFSGRTDGVSSSGPGSPVYSQTGSFITALNCVFSNIKIDYWGSAIQLWDAGADITNCLFLNNRAGLIDGYAALTYLNNSGAAETIHVTNCTFVGNRSAGNSSFAGAVHSRGAAGFTVRNSIFWDNGIYNEYGSGAAGNCNVQGGLGATGFTDGGGNISLDPQFVGGANYRLASGSPCIDAGNNSAPALPPFDMERNGRIYDGNKDGTATVDLGPFEFSSNISAAPGGHDFGTIGTGTVSVPQTFTLSNDGQADLEIGALLLAGPDASAFVLQNDGCSMQSVISAGSCTFELVFSPATSGAKEATLLIPSDDPDTATMSVFVNGNAIPVANVSVTPASKDFTVINVGSNSGSQTFTISNIGTADLIIGTASLTGADLTDFIVRNDHCSGQTIPPSGNCTFQARFSPAGEGSKTADLSIPSNDPDMLTMTVRLTGEATIQSVFDDCPESHWAEDFINTLSYSGITGGCGGSNYCPDNSVTRAQMAVFIIAAMGEMPSTAATNAYFDDVAEPYAGFINRMSELGIAAGCGDRVYCPNDLLTRAQMAVFIIAAMGESGSTAAHNTNFDDIANDVFAGFINRMTELGITGGCGGRNYCPGSSTNRAMMAVFLVTAF